MVRFDRIAEDVFIAISEMYVQVTSTVLLTPDGAIVIDTMPFPQETRQVRQFIADELGSPAIRYVVVTHHHADHVYGAFLYPEAEMVAHDLCREMLSTIGRPTLARAKRDTPALAEVVLRLPDISFSGEMDLTIGHRHMTLLHLPGHSPDGIGVYVDGVKALIAGDAMMPVPHIVNGNREQLEKTLRRIKKLQPSFVVQGHGDVLLKGEVVESVDSSIEYLDMIYDQVKQLIDRGDPPIALKEIDIESCGKSRIPLDGLASKLHLNNLVAVYKQLTSG